MWSLFFVWKFEKSRFWFCSIKDEPDWRWQCFSVGMFFFVWNSSVTLKYKWNKQVNTFSIFTVGTYKVHVWPGRRLQYFYTNLFLLHFSVVYVNWLKLNLKWNLKKSFISIVLYQNACFWGVIKSFWNIFGWEFLIAQCLLMVLCLQYIMFVGEAFLSFFFTVFYFHWLIYMHPHPAATLPHSSQGSSLFGHSGILHLLLHVHRYTCFHTYTSQFLDFWFWCFDLIYSFILFLYGERVFGSWWLMFSKLLFLFDWNLFLIFLPGTKRPVVLECKP